MLCGVQSPAGEHQGHQDLQSRGQGGKSPDVIAIKTHPHPAPASTAHPRPSQHLCPSAYVGPPSAAVVEAHVASGTGTSSHQTTPNDDDNPGKEDGSSERRNTAATAAAPAGAALASTAAALCGPIPSPRHGAACTACTSAIDPPRPIRAPGAGVTPRLPHPGHTPRWSPSPAELSKRSALSFC